MKKIISLVLSTMLLTITILSVSSCTKATTCFDNWPENRLHFEQKYFFCDRSNVKYKYYENIYYVFHSDGTGESHQTINNDNTVSSGIAYFEWRTTSDGAIHFFKTGTKLKNDNTDKSFNPSTRLYNAFVSEDFIYNDTTYYIRENSEIFKLFTKAE